MNAGMSVEIGDMRTEYSNKFRIPAISQDRASMWTYIAWLEEGFAKARLLNRELRKIASHVPPTIYLKAKEAAGYGEPIRSQHDTR